MGEILTTMRAAAPFARSSDGVHGFAVRTVGVLVLMLAITAHGLAQEAPASKPANGEAVGGAAGGVSQGSSDASAALTIDEAYRLAERSSDAIRIKQLAAMKARLAYGEAASRALPNVSVTASASYLVNPPTGITVTRGELGSFTIPNVGQIVLPQQDTVFVANAENTYYQASAELTQPLFTWGKIRNAISAANYEIQIADGEVTRQTRDIQRQVNRAYFSALLADRSVAILERMSAAVADIVADRSRAFGQGTITKAAVLDAQASAASIDAQLVEARESRLTALQSLDILIGADAGAATKAATAGGARGAGDRPLTTDFRSALPKLDEPSLLKAALAASSDLSSAAVRLAQARAKLAIERGSGPFRPDVNLDVTLSANGQRTPILGANWTDTWNWDLAVSIGMQMSLFDGLAASHRVGEAEQDLSVASAALDQYRQIVEMSVRRTIESAVKADAECRLDAARVAFDVEQLRNTKLSYTQGAATREQDRQAELALDRDRLALVLSQYDREQALADLEQLIGRRLQGSP